MPGDLDVALRDVVGGRGLGFDLHLDRVVQVLGGDLADRRRHGRGEQRDLLVLGCALEDAFDVLGEAHLQHLVGLVEHQVVEVRKVEGALLEVVDDPARRADDDLRATLETGHLRAVRGAAVDRQHVHGQMRAVAAERLGDLQREFSRRRQHQRLGDAARRVDLRQNRDGERRRLARAGLREADDVGAGHHRRNGRRLDGRGRFVADVGYGLQHRGVNLQVGEGGLRGRRVRFGRRHRVVSLVAHTLSTRRAACRVTQSSWRYGAQL